MFLSSLLMTPQRFSRLANDLEWCAKFQQTIKSHIGNKIRTSLEYDLLDLALKSDEGCKILAKNCIYGPGPVTEHQDYTIIINYLYERSPDLTAEEVEKSEDFIRFRIALDTAGMENYQAVMQILNETEKK